MQGEAASSVVSGSQAGKTCKTARSFKWSVTNQPRLLSPVGKRQSEHESLVADMPLSTTEDIKFSRCTGHQG